MKRTTEFTVDNVKYTSTQYPATKGLRLLTRLSKIAGAPIGKLSVAGMDAEVTPDLVGAAIESLTAQIDEVTVIDLVNDILSSTEVIGDTGRRPINFDLDFAGRYLHLFKLLRDVLAFQYNDFFGENAEVGAALRRMAPSVNAR